MGIIIYTFYLTFYNDLKLFSMILPVCFCLKFLLTRNGLGGIYREIFYSFAQQLNIENTNNPASHPRGKSGNNKRYYILEPEEKKTIIF